MRMTVVMLEDYGALCDELSELRLLIAEAEEIMSSARAQRITGMPSSGSDGRSLENMVAKHVELLDMYRKKEEELVEIIREIEDSLSSLPPILRRLVRMKYLRRLSYAEIADELKYSERTVRRLHEKALDIICR